MIKKVSIIVPVYNIQENELRKCLDSLVHQTISEYEVIVVDDGSNRYCADICEEYGKRYSVVSVIHQENKGVSVARNVGIENAKGEYIQFVDADDWIELNATEIYYEYAQSNDLDIILSSCTVDDGLAFEGKMTDDHIFNIDEIRQLQLTILNNNIQYLNACPMSPWAKLFRTKFIQKEGIHFIEGLKRMQDNLFCMYALGATSKVGYLHYNGYHYKQNAYSVCHRFNDSIISVFEKVLVEFEKYIHKNRSEDKEFWDSYFVKGIMILVSEYPKLYYQHKDNLLAEKERKKEYKMLCQKQMYEEIIAQVKLKNCYGAYKMFAYLLKHRWYNVYWLMLKLQRKYREKN